MDRAAVTGHQGVPVSSTALATGQAAGALSNKLSNEWILTAALISM